MKQLPGFTLGVLLTGLLAIMLTPQCNCLNGSVNAVFSPNADAEIVAFLSTAQNTIDVELYQFSNPQLKAALVEAVNRGVTVRLIMESRVESNYETASFLSKKGIQIKWGSLDYTNTHSKYCIVDNEKTIVGSTNWSRRAMSSNREASAIINDSQVANEFTTAFEEDWGIGVEYNHS